MLTRTRVTSPHRPDGSVVAPANGSAGFPWLAPSSLGEFHVQIEVRGLAQLDTAFDRVAGRREPVEGFHFGVNSLVTNATFALYRDFPDPVRHAGEERF